MLKKIQPAHPMFYVALVFLIFPFAGPFVFHYPMWTLWLTGLFTLAYLYLVHFRSRIWTPVAWFYLLAYTVYMSFFVEIGMIWFLFYVVNVLVWRFDDQSFLSWPWLSFFAEVLILAIFGIVLGRYFEGRVMVGIVLFLTIAMALGYRQERINEEQKEEIARQTNYINILSAENERNRIGRDLHDTLGHVFAMMTLKTELALKQMKKGQYEAVTKQLEDLNQISHDSMTEVRGIVNNLKYRTIAEELTELERLLDLADIELTVQLDLDLDNLSPLTQSTMTMVLRELANNVIKHSKASHCQLGLSRNKETIRVTCQDDGAGFFQVTGQELHSIRERMRLVRGQVEIVSASQPTLIYVTFLEGEKV